MDEHKVTRIKAAVKKNFDQSPEQYQAFEAEFGFFRRLNDRLLSRMELSAGAWILDVGCGTGASTWQILDTVPDCRVWGLDISPAMLEHARTAVVESDRVCFVEGDAARLSEYFHVLFDAVVYSASIFLIPDYRESLMQARGLLKNHAALGLTFMNGLYDRDGNNLLAMAEEHAAEGMSSKRAVNPEEFHSFFIQVFPHTRSWVEDFSLPPQLVRSFFSIPAMSAGLFPRIDYPERVQKVGRLFDHMPRTEVLFRWTIMVGQIRP
jgi:ubiquinone/menaquinone biosynthesis C-methylase UbiE